MRPDDGPVLHGNCGIVVPVRGTDGPLALKVSWRDDKTRWEAWALAAWAGNGAARLLAHRESAGALLLERLDPQASLERVPLDTAAAAAGRLLRRLSVPVTPPRDGPPRLAALAEEYARQWHGAPRVPIPSAVLDAARQTCRELGPDAGDLLVDQDLHYANVLRARREPWLAIDPKVVLGDPEFGVAPLLWNRFDPRLGPGELRRRLEVIVEAGELDPVLARRWSLVRVVEFWMWALDTGSTWGNRAAAALADWLGD
nr:aminoglycoside phosphotransferase family protein [Nocardiopsis mwathae]